MADARALAAAAGRGAAALQALLDQGADIDVRLKDQAEAKHNGQTALHVAARAGDAMAQARAARSLVSVHYVDGPQGQRLCFPKGHPGPTTPSPALAPSQITTCGAPGCSASKKYTCSRTGIPLCSLACYRVVNTCSG